MREKKDRENTTQTKTTAMLFSFNPTINVKKGFFVSFFLVALSFFFFPSCSTHFYKCFSLHFSRKKIVVLFFVIMDLIAIYKKCFFLLL